MNKTKKEFLKFLSWTRNGICFCTTWFLVLLILIHFLYEIPTFSTLFLAKMFGVIIGGVIIFNSLFTSLFIKNWSFTTRLTLFMIVISIYQCFCFYSLSIFQTKGSWGEWSIFIGLVLFFYFCSLGLYHIYSRKQGELYTKSLQEYQLKRTSDSE